MYIAPLINLANKKAFSCLFGMVFNEDTIQDANALNFMQFMSRANKALSFYYMGQIAYRLLDHGIANILGLQTMYHGTCLPNYLSIRVQGALCSKGGIASGATKGNVEDDTAGYFYLLKDSQTKVEDCMLGQSTIQFYNLRILRYFGYNPILTLESYYRFGGTNIFTYLGYNSFCLLTNQSHIPSQFAKLSTANYIINILPTELVGHRSHIYKAYPLSAQPKMQLIIEFFANFCPAPLLSFKYADTPSSFVQDPLAPFAFRTPEDQSPLRIGLIGNVYACYTAENSWYERVKADPIKPIVGAAELIAFCYLSQHLVNTISVDTAAQAAVAVGFMLA